MPDTCIDQPSTCESVVQVEEDKPAPIRTQPKPSSKRKIIISKLLRYAWKARSDQLIPKTSELYPTSTQPEFEMDFSVAGVINRIEEEEEEEIEEEYVI